MLNYLFSTPSLNTSYPVYRWTIYIGFVLLTTLNVVLWCILMSGMFRISMLENIIGQIVLTFFVAGHQLALIFFREVFNMAADVADNTRISANNSNISVGYLRRSQMVFKPQTSADNNKTEDQNQNFKSRQVVKNNQEEHSFRKNMKNNYL